MLVVKNESTNKAKIEVGDVIEIHARSYGENEFLLVVESGFNNPVIRLVNLSNRMLIATEYKDSNDIYIRYGSRLVAVHKDNVKLVIG